MAANQKEAGQSFRRERLHFQYVRFKRQWAIYYRSSYGKVGFYMLVFFAAVAILSPVLTLHNPLTFYAPTEDTYVSQIELSVHLPSSFLLNGTVYAPTASELAPAGSYLVYAGTPSGHVYGVGLGGSPTTANGTIYSLMDINLSAGVFAYPVSVFPLSSYSTFVGSGYSALSYSNYLLLSTNNGTIFLSRIQWSGEHGSGTGKPYLTDNETVYTNRTFILPVVSNSQSIASVPPAWVPFHSSLSQSSGFTPGMLFAVFRNSSGTYLSAYYTDPLVQSWIYRLPGNQTPSLPVFVGSDYTPGHTYAEQVLVADGNSMISIHALSGKLNWETNLTSAIDSDIPIHVPRDYQLGIVSGSMAFVASGNYFYGFSLSNGTAVKVYQTASPVTGYSSSYGSSGFPAYTAVFTSSDMYILSNVNKLLNSNSIIPVPKGEGKYFSTPSYAPDTSSFILSTGSGFLTAVSTQGGKDAFEWHAKYPGVITTSSPALVKDSFSGEDTVAFITSSQYLVLYSTTGVDINPIPPTLHAPSGNVYLFGTNIYGQDVWSQWVASFVYDWEIGIAVAIGIIVISVVFAVIVGYLGGFIGSVVETVSLVIFLIPFIALLIVMSSVLGPSLTNIILVLTLVGWPFTTFTLIGVVRSIKSHAFIEAAKISGARSMQILRRHFLSNMTPLLAYFTAIGIGGAVAGVSTLQFLGVAPLDISTWGAMLNATLSNFFLAARAPWWILPPSIALTAFVFAFVFVSRGLDEVVNPRLRSR
ncbi:MAG: ABC transporter permease [Thermoplasmata archaeon]|uniref:ABC transporter permease n=1 Tax=Candidatus Sysuiplasma superficiale TaxID=2823368 RepID=A0A8J8CAN1_9ARCH|nr:ABC transporter permease [Candidatus Sysuiplasma superficiale]MBX8644209.1 ABC transporter permease [Candidatus Sysuiplasma superficiale]